MFGRKRYTPGKKLSEGSPRHFEFAGRDGHNYQARKVPEYLRPYDNAGDVKVPLSELAEIQNMVSPREITRGIRRVPRPVCNGAGGKAFDKVVGTEASLKPFALLLTTRWNSRRRTKRRNQGKIDICADTFPRPCLRVLASHLNRFSSRVILLTIPLEAPDSFYFFKLGKPLTGWLTENHYPRGIAVNTAIILIDR